MRSDEPHPPADSDTERQPMRTEHTVTAVGGVALVSVTLHNDTAAALRVRVENDLDGPALPPRREGVPLAGWDGDRFTGVVPADGRLGVGYACPVADPDATSLRTNDAPASAEILGPAADGADDPEPSDRVAAAVRSLGRAAPPADAVPAGAGATSTDHTANDRGSDPDATGGRIPQPASGWLDAVERRVELAERLTDASAADAAAAIEDCGGIDDAAALPTDLGRDVDALRSVGDRIDDLVSRAAAADPAPVVSSLTPAANGEPPTDRDARPDSDTSSPSRRSAGADTPGGRTR